MITDKQFERRIAKIAKELNVARVYYIDGAPASAARCLIAAQVGLAQLTQDANDAGIEKARMFEALPRREEQPTKKARRRP